MHHFKCNVGSGIFALGDAFKNAGLILAPPLMIFLGVICIHAQHILVCTPSIRINVCLVYTSVLFLIFLFRLL